MLTAMRNDIPDRVPVAPDMSNMIPCRLTGKPFWDIYLYQDPPLWQAYIAAANYFGIDGWIYNLDGFWLPDPSAPAPDSEVRYETVIIERNAQRIVTRGYSQRTGEKEWSAHVTVYPRYDPPTTLLAEKIGLAPAPERWEPIEGVKPEASGFDLLREGLERFQERGVIGVYVGPPQLGNPELGSGYSVYDYYDRYAEVKAACAAQHQAAVAYLKRVLAGPVRPDFILTGGSGMLVFNTPEIIRDSRCRHCRRSRASAKRRASPRKFTVAGRNASWWKCVRGRPTSPLSIHWRCRRWATARWRRSSVRSAASSG